MKNIHIPVIATAMLLGSQAIASEPQTATQDAPVPAVEAVAPAPDTQPGRTQLSLDELDRVTAGDLGLPNGNVLFEGFDNAAPGQFHPNFDRSETGFDASGNEGPWSAHFYSPVIECPSCGG